LRDVDGALLNTLVIAAGKRGDLLEVLELERQSTQIDRETGHRINEAIGLLNLGAGWLKLGDLAQAQRDLDAALQMARAHGDKTIEGATLGGLSTLALRHGEPALALALARQSLDIAVAAQARDEAVIAALRLGEAELSLGRPGEARQAYAQARAGALEIEDPRRHDASAGLAQVALAAGNDAALQDALRALQPVLDAVAGGDQLEGTDDARQIELTCHQALSRASDPGANAWLARAHGALMAQADEITDPAVRQGFLRNIPCHRDIVAAWVEPEAARVAPTEPMD
jgi:tetratricopeptide (TPR) repeat protein